MYPAGGQRAAIKSREGLELLEPPRKIVPERSVIRLHFSMPVHSVSLLCISLV